MSCPSALQCLEKGFPAQIKIGATTTVSDNEGQAVSVCSATIHPSNNMDAMENDIAILKLCDPISITAYGQYNRDADYPGATGVDVYIHGFGRTDVYGDLSPILQKAKIDYLDNPTCAARYNKYNGDQTFCADSPTSAICYGDSGGPVTDVEGLVVGLNSYIVDTCASSYPDFFVRLSSYASWLDEMICEQAIDKPEWCADIVSSSGTGVEGDDDEAQDDDDVGGIADSIAECLSLLLGLMSNILGGR